MDGWMNEWIDCLVDGLIDEGWMDGEMERWFDG